MTLKKFMDPIIQYICESLFPKFFKVDCVQEIGKICFFLHIEKSSPFNTVQLLQLYACHSHL